MRARHARADAWEGRPADAWQARLGVPRLRIYSVIGSTSTLALRLARSGAPHGTCIIAEEQRTGRGRFGRRWLDTAGKSLLLSVVLRTGLQPDAAPGAAPIRCGIALLDAIQSATGYRALLKWPNDILSTDGRKVAGILCEGSVAASGAGFIIAGFGINVNQDERDWDDALRTTAASLSLVADRPVSRGDLAEALLQRLLAVPGFTAPLTAGELDALHGRLAYDHTAITVDGRPAGQITGIDADGALRVATRFAEERILSGTIRPAGDRPLPLQTG
jgi:BirA family transcriptional regulator, biotin operon repressor / biotin---[acetyl-CoA-carboxylase] ligase